MTTEPYVIRDLGTKLADDFGAACARVVDLVRGDPVAAAQIIDIALSAPLGALMASRLVTGKTPRAIACEILISIATTLDAAARGAEAAATGLTCPANDRS